MASSNKTGPSGKSWFMQNSKMTASAFSVIRNFSYLISSIIIITKFFPKIKRRAAQKVSSPCFSQIIRWYKPIRKRIVPIRHPMRTVHPIGYLWGNRSILMIYNSFHLGEGRFRTPFPQFLYFSRYRIRTSQPLRHPFRQWRKGVWNICAQFR